MVYKKTRISIYIPITLLIAAFFWMTESLIHFFLYGVEVFEVIPADFTELWMRSLIVILVVGFGIFADYSIGKRVKELEERKKIYKDRANDAKKILKEFLHDVQYFESEAERIGGFDGSTMQHLEGALKKTKDRLDSLDALGDLTLENKIMHE